MRRYQLGYIKLFLHYPCLVFKRKSELFINFCLTLKRHLESVMLSSESLTIENSFKGKSASQMPLILFRRGKLKQQIITSKLKICWGPQNKS
jgi:hypothetical protein